MKKFRYKNILTLATLQFDGHFQDYFIENSEKAVVFYKLPRGGQNNFVEVYKKGRRTIKRELFSPENIFLSYLFLYGQYISVLFKYFRRDEKVFFINYIPALFFLWPVLKLVRNVDYVFRIGDYWPMNDILIVIYRFITHLYHRFIKYSFYQTDRINKEMNGYIKNDENKKTIRYGLGKPKIDIQRKMTGPTVLCFIGVFVERQGLDYLLEVVSKNKNLHLKLIGSGHPQLVRKYQTFVKSHNMEDRVYFPNKFLYRDELYDQVRLSHIGIVLYEEEKKSVTYYATPAKVYQFLEYGLPVIMSGSAEVTDLLKKHKAGIVVKRKPTDILKAIDTIKKNYPDYLKGIQSFYNEFNYQSYFAKKFVFLK